MTANSTSFADGTYTTSSSTNYSASFLPYQMFDGVIGNNGWASVSIYLSATGAYNGSVTTAGYAGEYFQMTMPIATVLKKYSVLPSSADIRCTGKNWRVFGSQNGSTWTQVDERTNQTSWTSGVYNDYVMNSNTTAYLTYRFVFNALNNIDLIWIHEVKLYGTR